MLAPSVYLSHIEASRIIPNTYTVIKTMKLAIFATSLTAVSGKWDGRLEWFGTGEVMLSSFLDSHSSQNLSLTDR